jgi:hypothetical protein
VITEKEAEEEIDPLLDHHQDQIAVEEAAEEKVEDLLQNQILEGIFLFLILNKIEN